MDYKHWTEFFRSFDQTILLIRYVGIMEKLATLLSIDAYTVEMDILNDLVCN